jgi:hypothetical protein
MATLVQSWGDDYTFSFDNLSARLSVDVPFTKSGFAEQVTAELTRWSHLGPIIDDGLSRL